MKYLILFATFLGVSACAMPVFKKNTARGSCGASYYEHLKGGPDTAVEATSFFQPVRITRSRNHVTSDFVADRLNFLLDGSGTVTAITCG